MSQPSQLTLNTEFLATQGFELKHNHAGTALFEKRLSGKKGTCILQMHVSHDFDVEAAFTPASTPVAPEVVDETEQAATTATGAGEGVVSETSSPEPEPEVDKGEAEEAGEVAGTNGGGDAPVGEAQEEGKTSGRPAPRSDKGTNP